MLSRLGKDVSSIPADLNTDIYRSAHSYRQDHYLIQRSLSQILADNHAEYFSMLLRNKSAYRATRAVVDTSLSGGTYETPPTIHISTEMRDEFVQKVKQCIESLSPLEKHKLFIQEVLSRSEEYKDLHTTITNLSDALHEAGCNIKSKNTLETWAYNICERIPFLDYKEDDYQLFVPGDGMLHALNLNPLFDRGTLFFWRIVEQNIISLQSGGDLGSLFRCTPTFRRLVAAPETWNYIPAYLVAVHTMATMLDLLYEQGSRLIALLETNDIANVLDTTVNEHKTKRRKKITEILKKYDLPSSSIEQEGVASNRRISF